MLQPTNPIRNDNDLNEFSTFVSKAPNQTFVSVTPIKKIFSNEGGVLKPLGYDFFERSQDVKPFFKENGQYYYFPINNLLRIGKIDENLYPVITNEPLSFIDIDDEVDFEIASKLV